MSLAAYDQLTLAPSALAGLHVVTKAEANDLVVRYEHNLGPCNRPFHSDYYALIVGADAVAVAISSSVVSATAAGIARKKCVELARLAGEPWATRVMLRLWREVCAPAWPCWPISAAIAYSQNDRHEGRIYRFDGWEQFTLKGGSSGGGTWSKKRTADDAVHGDKTGWLWRYGAVA